MERLSKVEIRNGLEYYFKNNVCVKIDSVYADVKNMKYEWIDEGFTDLIHTANEMIDNMANYVESKTGVILTGWANTLKIKEDIVSIEMAIDLQPEYLYIFVYNMVENSFKNLYMLVEEI